MAKHEEGGKHMKKVILSIGCAAFLASLLVSCSNSLIDANTPVSDSCNQAMQAASLVPGDQNNDSMLEVAANACPTVNEFGAAGILYPAAVGLTSANENDVLLFIPIVCYYFPQTAMCLDAQQLGLLTDEP